MTTEEAVRLFRSAVVNGEDPDIAASIVDGDTAGRSATEQRLKALEENVAWLIRSQAKLAQAVVRLNGVAKGLEARAKEVEGEI